MTMGEWRTIDSAPKDGSEIDFWAHSLTDRRHGHARLCGYVWDSTYQCFRTKTDLHFINKPEHVKLTHWMPAAQQPAEFADVAALWARYKSAFGSLRRWRLNHRKKVPALERI